MKISSSIRSLLHRIKIAKITSSALSNIKIILRIATYKSGFKAYWWDESQNFGDLFTPRILKELDIRKSVNCRGLRLNVGEVLVGAGSLLQSLKYKNAVIWGSGFIEPPPSPKDLRRPAKVLACRGPKTLEIAKELDWPHTEILADPGLLSSYFWPKQEKEYYISIVPHYMHVDEFRRSDLCDYLTFINVRCCFIKVIQRIASSKVIISSSLHGLITAHSYGIPWVWVEFSTPLAGERFKFYDFLESMEVVAEPMNFKNLHQILMGSSDDIYNYCVFPDLGKVKDKQAALISALSEYVAPRSP